MKMDENKVEIDTVALVGAILLNDKNLPDDMRTCVKIIVKSNSFRDLLMAKNKFYSNPENSFNSELTERRKAFLNWLDKSLKELRELDKSGLI